MYIILASFWTCYAPLEEYEVHLNIYVCISFVADFNMFFLQILRLQECLSKYEKSSDGITPQVVDSPWLVDSILS